MLLIGKNISNYSELSNAFVPHFVNESLNFLPESVFKNWETRYFYCFDFCSFNTHRDGKIQCWRGIHPIMVESNQWILIPVKFGYLMLFYTTSKWYLWEWPLIIFRVATARKCYCRKQNAVSAFGHEHYTLRIDVGCKMCKILRKNKLFFLPEMLTSTPFTWKGTMKLSEHVVSSGAFSHYFHGQAHKKILSINFSFFSRFSGGDRTRHV